MELVEGGLELRQAVRAQRAVIFAGAFLVLWLIGWSVGCVMLISHVVANPSLFMILFAIPFVAAWFFVIFLILAILFGSERLWLGPEGLEYDWKVLRTLGERRVPLAELRSVRAGARHRDNESGASSLCVNVETVGKPLDFGSGLSEKEQRWLVEVLSDYLAMLREQRSRQSGLSTDASELSSRPDQGSIVNASGAALPVTDLPSDSDLRLERFADGITCVWRGRWSKTVIGTMTFVMLFWDGIVGVFIHTLIQDFRWDLCLFLIPFEIIGLAFVLIWFAALTAPAWSWGWVFRTHDIERRLSGFGISWTRRYELPLVDRIEVDSESQDEERKYSAQFPGFPEGRYSVSLITPEGREVVEIGRLTAGEARWLAEMLRREFPAWFTR
jgi:hypothetical protein